MIIELEIPEKCDNCGRESLKIWGTRTQGKLEIKIRCWRCGKVLWEYG